MYKTKTRTFRSGLALLMVLCMVFGLFGPAASIKADAAETESLKYVSLGDSMVNGYGLDGYEYEYHTNPYEECTDPDCEENHVVWHWSNGYLQEAPASYPVKLAKHFGWDLTQLAVSAMRVEDLHWVLEYDYNNAKQKATAHMSSWNEEIWNDAFTNGDYFTWNEFTTSRWANQVYPGCNVEDVAKKFQESVASADVISLGIGNGNFGVFLLGRIMEAIGFDTSSTIDKYNVESAVRNLDAGFKAEILSLVDALYAQVEAKGINTETGLMADLMDTLSYAMVSYVINYRGSIDAIVELNPDAEIIIVGLMNTMDGMMFSVNGQTIDMGELMGTALGVVSAYMTALPTALQAAGEYPEATFYYAEAANVDVNVNNYATEIGSSNTVRDRFVTEIVGENGTANGMVWGLLNGDADTTEDDMVVGITLTEINAYTNMRDAEKLNYAASAPAKARSIAMYLAFENAILAASDPNDDKVPVLSLESFANLSNLGSIFNNVMNDFDANKNTCTEDQKSVAATFVAGNSNGQLTAEILLCLMNGTVDAYDVVASSSNCSAEQVKAVYGQSGYENVTVSVDAINDAVESAKTLCMLLALPTNLSTSLQKDEIVFGLLNLFARCLIGSGLGAHPSAAGHQELFDVIKKSYEEHYTAKDETIENVKIVLDELYDLIQTYGPEVAAQVWAQWEEYGYVDAVNATIAELETMLQTRYTYYTETALPAINDSIVAMTEQKDVLADEIAALKAELAAKKAELAEVIAKQEIGDIYVPDINIDALLGDNEQTEVPDRECVVEGETIEAELNAAIADLEHAIAVIEALIADIDADIADMIALAEQIAAAVAELEKTMIDVAAAIEDLSVAFDQVVAVLKDNQGVVDAVVSSYEAARATALAAVQVLELTMGTANEMMGDIDAMITVIAEDAEALYNKFVSELPGCIEQIPAEAAYLAAPVLLIQQYVEKNKEEINAKLRAEILKLAEQYDIDVVAVQAQIDELTALFNADEAEQMAKLQELAAQYGIDEAAIKAELDNIKTQIKIEADALYTEKAAEFQAQIDALNAEASAKLDALNAELAQYEAELAAAAADAKAGIQAQIDRVLGDIDTVNAELACAIGHVENAAQLAYDEIVAEVTAAYDEAVAELQKALDELKAAYDKATADVQKALDELKNTYDNAVAELQKALDELKAAYDKAVDELTAAADKVIADLIAEADKQIAELGKLGDALNEALDGVYEAIRDELSAAQNAMEEVLKGQLESVKDLVKAVADLGMDGLNAIANELVEQINALIAEATTADLVIDDEFKYVALGDSSAAAESYVEKLAAALNDEAAENGIDAIEVVNYAKAGNTVAAERANLSDVSGADLITIGFSNVEFLSKAVDAALSQEPVEFDWAAVVGAENVQYVDQMLAEVAEMIAENGIEGEAAVMVNTAIEAYAYAAAQYATELPELVNEINAVNPDAVVIVVGMYNPMDGVVITLDENVTLDISDYLDYLVEGVAAHGIAYSIISGNSIYVDAPEVSTTNTDSDLFIFDLMRMAYAGFNTLYPSDAGEDYIAAEIADALNITYVKSEPGVLLGDADRNGVVNLRDAMLILKAANNHEVDIDREVSDVTGDGMITLADAMWVQKRANGRQDLFPVEK